MEIVLDCLPCFLRQVLEASRHVTDQVDLQEKIMLEAVDLISDYHRYCCSPQIGRAIHAIVKKHTGIIDPYREIKDKNIQNALEIYPDLQSFLSGKPDKLYWALKIAVTGNIIDAAIYRDIDIKGSLEKELGKEFVICDIDILKSRMKHAKTLLIIGDNAGETVFDRVLAEMLPQLEILYAVRSAPVINDATMEDAIASGLQKCTHIISSGCDAPGLLPDECSQDFLKILNEADIVISKGQGNYEALSDYHREIFFLLKAKCPVLAERLEVNVNDYVFKVKNGG